DHNFVVVDLPRPDHGIQHIVIGSPSDNYLNGRGQDFMNSTLFLRDTNNDNVIDTFDLQNMLRTQGFTQAQVDGLLPTIALRAGAEVESAHQTAALLRT